MITILLLHLFISHSHKVFFFPFIEFFLNKSNCHCVIDFERTQSCRKFFFYFNLLEWGSKNCWKKPSREKKSIRKTWYTYWLYLKNFLQHPTSIYRPVKPTPFFSHLNVKQLSLNKAQHSSSGASQKKNTTTEGIYKGPN